MPPLQSDSRLIPTDASRSETARIDVRGLTKTFPMKAGTLTAVNNVSFKVRKGEFVSLLGPSGSGKSTVLNMIATLLAPSNGSILIDGEVQTHVANPKVGYVFQRNTLFPWRTISENIGYALEAAGINAAQRRAQVTDCIRQAGLVGFEDVYPSALSGGMQQRAQLMRTLVRKPEVLLMDEPFGALDTHTKLDMHRVLLDIWERERQTVLFVTHDLSEALTLSDRIILFSARPGQIKAEFEVNFPRPRDEVRLRETDHYSQLFSKVWHSLGEEFRKARAE